MWRKRPESEALCCLPCSHPRVYPPTTRSPPRQATAPQSQAEEDEAVATRLAALLNLAACAQREAEYGEAIGWCNKAVE